MYAVALSPNPHCLPVFFKVFIFIFKLKIMYMYMQFALLDYLFLNLSIDGLLQFTFLCILKY